MWHPHSCVPRMDFVSRLGARGEEGDTGPTERQRSERRAKLQGLNLECEDGLQRDPAILLFR